MILRLTNSLLLHSLGPNTYYISRRQCDNCLIQKFSVHVLPRLFLRSQILWITKEGCVITWFDTQTGGRHFPWINLVFLRGLPMELGEGKEWNCLQIELYFLMYLSHLTGDFSPYDANTGARSISNPTSSIAPFERMKLIFFNQKVDIKKFTIHTNFNHKPPYLHIHLYFKNSHFFSNHYSISKQI